MSVACLGQLRRTSYPRDAGDRLSRSGRGAVEIRWILGSETALGHAGAEGALHHLLDLGQVERARSPVEAVIVVAFPLCPHTDVLGVVTGPGRRRGRGLLGARGLCGRLPPLAHMHGHAVGNRLEPLGRVNGVEPVHPVDLRRWAGREAERQRQGQWSKEGKERGEAI